MRLSDAIALGRVLLKPRPYTTILDDEGCALGMAFAALGCKTHEEAMQKCSEMKIWSWCGKQAVLPCNCDDDGVSKSWGKKKGSYHAAIVHLFNEHVCGEEDWTLDRLIDWIRSVEPIDEEQQIQPQVSQESLTSMEAGNVHST